MINISKVNKAISGIKAFNKYFRDINPRIPQKIVGEMGEYYVLRELFRRGCRDIEHRGGHSGFDILLTRRNVRVEVKTSLLKNDGLYPEGINFWGWRVKTRGQKRDEKFDFLICVALDQNFKSPKFYIFSYKEAYSAADVNMGRFKSVQKKINLFESKKALRKAEESKPKYVTDLDRLVTRRPSKFLDKWNKLI